MDHERYEVNLMGQLLQFPDQTKEQQLAEQFSFFLNAYYRSKENVQAHRWLDAYSAVLDALHHWARIVIIEDGASPQASVWNQVRKINPGVYKLFEELALSTETVKQRVELVLLACEFAALSKLELCSSILLRLIRSRHEPWAICELQTALASTRVDVPLLLNKLVKKSLVHEVTVKANDTVNHEVRYLVVI